MTPKQIAEILRELGVSDKERQRYRRAVREYADLYKDIKSSNRHYGINHEPPLPSDESLIRHVRAGKSINELTSAYKEQTKIYSKTGQTKQFNEEVSHICDILNKYSGTTDYHPELFTILSPSEFERIATLIQEIEYYLDLYDEHKSERFDAERAYKALVQINTILGISH